jgi:hypothetical protein
MALQFAVTSWAIMCPGQLAAAQLPEKPGPEVNRAETDVRNVQMKAIVILLKYARVAKATGTVIQKSIIPFGKSTISKTLFWSFLSHNLQS